MASRTVSMTEFKANCAALLEEVGASGDTITVTKRGRALATVTPPPRRARKPKSESLEGSLVGKVYIPNDILMGDYSADFDIVSNPERVLHPEKFRGQP